MTDKQYPPLPPGLPAYDLHGKQLKVHWDAEQMRAYVDVDRAQREQSHPMQSVLVDGVAYDVPIEVAAEMLALHLEIREARQDARRARESHPNAGPVTSTTFGG